MSLRPADLSGMLQQSNNVASVTQSVAQQGRVHQDVVTQQMIVQTDNAQSQVQGTPQAEGNTIRGDGGGGGGGGRGGGGRKRQPESAPPEAAPSPGRSRPRKRGPRIDFRA